MKQYTNYKNLNTSQISEIPSDWHYMRLKHISNIIKGRKAKEDYQDYDSRMIPYLSMEYLRNQTEFPTYVLADDENITRIDEGDLLILWDGSKAGEFVKSKFGALSSTMGKIELKSDKFSPNYIWYFLKSCENVLQENTIGMGIPHVDGEVLRNLVIFEPSFEEQTQIARFLDYQTGIIDDIISKKEKLIELLKEQRQSIMNEAVTKGLVHNASLKESGVGWLGKVPENWSLCKLKYLVNMKSGDSITSETIESQGKYPVYGGNGLRGYTDHFTNEGDFVLIGRQGALCGNINYAHGKFWASEHAIVVYPRIEIDTYYLGELLRIMNLNQYSESAAQPGVSVSKIMNLLVPKVPINEQRKISNYLQNHEMKSESILKNIHTQIECLKEYRQSLIYEAVTGKIDVRDWQPPVNK